MNNTYFQNQFFNPQYVNADYIRQLQIERYNAEQMQEIQKAMKATKDLCDSIKKITPDYQQTAFALCVEVVLRELYNK